jgi:Amt family ammonium transporter
MRELIGYEGDFNACFWSLFDKVPDAVCACAADNTIVAANAAFVHLFGYSQEEMVGRLISDLIIPQDRKHEVAELIADIDQNGIGRIETTRRRKDGSLIQVVVTRFEASDSPDDRTHFIVYTNIQELRDTKIHLKLAEDKYRTIFEEAVDGIYQTSLDGRFLVANPALARILGYSSSQALMESSLDIRTQFYLAPGRRDEFARIIAETGKISGFESQARRLDGSVVWVSETARIVYANGEMAYYEGTLRDITARKQAEEALKASRERYRSLIRSAPDGILTIKDLVVTGTNLKALEMFGYSVGQMLGLSVMDISPPFQAGGIPSSEFARLLDEQAMSGETQNFDWLHKRKDGSVFSAEVSLNRFEAHGESFLTAVIRDVSARKRTERALERERAHLRMLFEASPQAMLFLDPTGYIVNVNHAFTKLFGHSKEEALDKDIRKLILPQMQVAEVEESLRTVRTGAPVSKETVRLSKAGVLIPVFIHGYPIVIGAVFEGSYFIYEDITERKSFEAQLTHQAFHDSLTGLPNRNLFLERLGRAMERGKRRPGYQFAVLLLDLDRFKRINDSLGHLAGDLLLKGIARRLEACLRSVDTVARLGGDEFAILLEEFVSAREVIQVADRIREALDRPFQVSGNEVYCAASIGIVLKTLGYSSAEEILRDSDIAMYRSKESGKDRLAFTRKMHEMAVENMRMENELRQGLKNGDLTLHYQPVVSVSDGKLQGFEALVRWHHPQFGLIPPARFIPLAEETGLIVPLGEWVINQALRQLYLWRKETANIENLFVSVNISSKQFRQPDLVDSIRRSLIGHHVDSSLLKLEITESVIMQDAKNSVEKLNKLKALGVELLVDDFGTGYSSLSYLQRFPISGLKIDRSFISGGGDERENMEIVRTIIVLAANLGLDVVAEGVETGEQLQRLKTLGCGSAQGYFFSRPLDGPSARRFIEEGPSPPGPAQSA